MLFIAEIQKANEELSSSMKEYITSEISTLKSSINSNTSLIEANSGILTNLEQAQRSNFDQNSMSILNLENELRTITNQMRNEMDELLDSLNNLAEYNQNWRDEIISFQKKLKRERSDTQNEIVHMNNKIKDSTTLSGVVKNALETMARIIWNLVEIGQMQLSIQSNDLKDRKTISLYGNSHETKGGASRTISGKNNKAANVTVKLDKKCISCTGNSSHDVISMFKTAWLNYEPSPLKYRDRTFTYEQILQIKYDIIGQCVNQLVGDEVFRTLEIHPKRVYDDTILEYDKTVPTFNKKESKNKISSLQKFTMPQRREMIDEFMNTESTMNGNVYHNISDSPIASLSATQSKTPFVKENRNERASAIKPYLYDANQSFEDNARTTIGNI